MITTTYSLVEICKIRSGKRLPKGCDFSEAPTAYKYIRARDIKNGTIDGSDLVYISEEVQSKINKYIVNTNDIVITIVGASVGDVAYVVSEFDGMNLTENAVRLTEFAPYVNSKYLMYILNSSEYWELMQQIAGGAAQPKLGIYKIEAIKVHLPPKEVQDRIVDILCTYDDLIENNQKQIELLEEAAQRLYKEWFVDLRFPGHETTPIIDGIPEGWVEGTMADLAVFKRGKTITKGQVNEGSVPVVAGGLEPAYYHDTPNTDAPVITVSGSGANAGFTRMYYTKVWASDCSYIDMSVTHDIAWVYCFLKENKASIGSMQKGAAQPHVYAKDLNAMKVVIPCDSLMEQFRTVVGPMFSKIGNLEMQTKQLAEARDRLLFKLMNGEIEV